MRIGIRKAHTKASTGASGYINEWQESRNLFPKVVELLSPYHTIIDCTPPETSEVREWNIGVKTANNQNPKLDLFFSIHFNSASGDPQGTEACVYSLDGTSANYAKKIVDNIAKLGFKNRGLKKRTDLAETANIKCPSFVLEVCFCQKSDGKLYKEVGVEKIARAIANAIDSRISLTASTTSNSTTKPTDSTTAKPTADLNATTVIKSYKETGRATVTGTSSLNVRSSYELENNTIVASYTRNQSFNYDQVYITKYRGIQYVWCSYIASSRARRYCCAKEGNKRYLTCV